LATKVLPDGVIHVRGSHLAGLDQGFDLWQRAVRRSFLHGFKLTYLVLFGKLVNDV